ncbi:MAG: hypothetical protein QG608_1650 [Actinomycetota bacterium]|nr:hypothetical protein [Actinomycetota bacterium]
MNLHSGEPPRRTRQPAPRRSDAPALQARPRRIGGDTQREPVLPGRCRRTAYSSSVQAGRRSVETTHKACRPSAVRRPLGHRADGTKTSSHDRGVAQRYLSVRQATAGHMLIDNVTTRAEAMFQ